MGGLVLLPLAALWLGLGRLGQQKPVWPKDLAFPWAMDNEKLWGLG